MPGWIGPAGIGHEFLSWAPCGILPGLDFDGHRAPRASRANIEIETRHADDTRRYATRDARHELNRNAACRYPDGRGQGRHHGSRARSAAGGAHVTQVAAG